MLLKKKKKKQATDIMVQWSGTRRDAVRSGQKLLDAGVFWPLDGPMTLEDSDRMYMEFIFFVYISILFINHLFQKV